MNHTSHARPRERATALRSTGRWPVHVVSIQSSTATCLDDSETLLKHGIKLCQYRDGPSALIGAGVTQPHIVIVPTDVTGIRVVDFVTALVELTTIPVLVGVLPDDASHTLGFRALEHGARGLIPLPSSSERIAAAIAQLGFLRTESASELHRGTLTLNPLSLRVTVGQVSVNLAPKEFEILKHLMLESPRVISVDEITAHAKDAGPGGATRTRLAILRTRKKLADASPSGESFIETVRGVGYRMALDNS